MSGAPDDRGPSVPAEPGSLGSGAGHVSEPGGGSAGAESAPPRRGGRLHPGAPPRLRKVGRTAAVVLAVGFFAVLAVLTARYSHDFSPGSAEDAEPRPPSRTAPLSAERIEEYARQRLQDELRARQRPPAPPALELPDEFRGGELGASEVGGSSRPYELVAPPPPPAPRLSAIGSSLSPAGGRSSGTSGLGSGRSGSAALAGGSPAMPAPLADLRSRLEAVQRAGAFGSAESGAASAPLPAAAGDPGPALELPDLGAFRMRPSFSSARAGGSVLPRLSVGAVVPLVLTHDVGTEVPGPVRAWVARDVYDSVTHSVIVLPRGTVVVGSQSERATVGDERMVVVWRRLRLPSGVTYELPGLPAGSADGTAGAAAAVDRHWWGRLGSAVALSLVGAGVQLSQPQQRTAVQGYAADEGQVLAQQLGLELGRLSQEMLRRGLDRPPTLRLRAGQRLSLLVARDLVFPR